MAFDQDSDQGPQYHGANTIVQDAKKGRKGPNWVWGKLKLRLKLQRRGNRGGGRSPGKEEQQQQQARRGSGRKTRRSPELHTPPQRTPSAHAAKQQDSALKKREEPDHARPGEREPRTVSAVGLLASLLPLLTAAGPATTGSRCAGAAAQAGHPRMGGQPQSWWCREKLYLELWR